MMKNAAKDGRHSTSSRKNKRLPTTKSQFSSHPRKQCRKRLKTCMESNKVQGVIILVVTVDLAASIVRLVFFDFKIPPAFDLIVLLVLTVDMVFRIAAQGQSFFCGGEKEQREQRNRRVDIYRRFFNNFELLVVVCCWLVFVQNQNSDTQSAVSAGRIARVARPIALFFQQRNRLIQKAQRSMEDQMFTVLLRMMGDVLIFRRDCLRCDPLNGVFQLKKAEINKETFKDVYLPFTLMGGFVRIMYVSAPVGIRDVGKYRSAKSLARLRHNSTVEDSPVKVRVIIKDVLIFFGPTEIGWNGDDASEVVNKSKHKLAEFVGRKFDMLGTTDNSFSRQYKNNVKKNLISKLKNAAEINISNVTVRYEDTCTKRCEPFACGVKLGALTLERESTFAKTGSRNSTTVARKSWIARKVSEFGNLAMAEESVPVSELFEEASSKIEVYVQIFRIERAFAFWDMHPKARYIQLIQQQPPDVQVFPLSKLHRRKAEKDGNQFVFPAYIASNARERVKLAFMKHGFPSHLDKLKEDAITPSEELASPSSSRGISYQANEGSMSPRCRPDWVRGPADPTIREKFDHHTYTLFPVTLQCEITWRAEAANLIQYTEPPCRVEAFVSPIHVAIDSQQLTSFNLIVTHLKQWLLEDDVRCTRPLQSIWWGKKLKMLYNRDDENDALTRGSSRSSMASWQSERFDPGGCCWGLAHKKAIEAMWQALEDVKTKSEVFGARAKELKAMAAMGHEFRDGEASEGSDEIAILSGCLPGCLDPSRGLHHENCPWYGEQAPFALTSRGLTKLKEIDKDRGQINPGDRLSWTLLNELRDTGVWDTLCEHGGLVDRVTNQARPLSELAIIRATLRAEDQDLPKIMVARCSNEAEFVEEGRMAAQWILKPPRCMWSYEKGLVIQRRLGGPEKRKKLSTVDEQEKQERYFVACVCFKSFVEEHMEKGIKSSLTSASTESEATESMRQALADSKTESEVPRAEATAEARARFEREWQKPRRQARLKRLQSYIDDGRLEELSRCLEDIHELFPASETAQEVLNQIQTGRMRAKSWGGTVQRARAKVQQMIDSRQFSDFEQAQKDAVQAPLEKDDEFQALLCQAKDVRSITLKLRKQQKAVDAMRQPFVDVKAPKKAPRQSDILRGCLPGCLKPSRGVHHKNCPWYGEKAPFALTFRGVAKLNEIGRERDRTNPGDHMSWTLVNELKDNGAWDTFRDQDGLMDRLPSQARPLSQMAIIHANLKAHNPDFPKTMMAKHRNEDEFFAEGLMAEKWILKPPRCMWSYEKGLIINKKLGKPEKPKKLGDQEKYCTACLCFKGFVEEFMEKANHLACQTSEVEPEVDGAQSEGLEAKIEEAESQAMRYDAILDAMAPRVKERMERLQVLAVYRSWWRHAARAVQLRLHIFPREFSCKVKEDVLGGMEEQYVSLVIQSKFPDRIVHGERILAVQSRLPVFWHIVRFRKVARDEIRKMRGPTGSGRSLWMSVRRRLCCFPDESDESGDENVVSLAVGDEVEECGEDDEDDAPSDGQLDMARMAWSHPLDVTVKVQSIQVSILVHSLWGYVCGAVSGVRRRASEAHLTTARTTNLASDLAEAIGRCQEVLRRVTGSPKSLFDRIQRSASRPITSICSSPSPEKFGFERFQPRLAKRIVFLQLFCDNIEGFSRVPADFFKHSSATAQIDLQCTQISLKNMAAPNSLQDVCKLQPFTHQGKDVVFLMQLAGQHDQVTADLRQRRESEESNCSLPGSLPVTSMHEPHTPSVAAQQSVRVSRKMSRKLKSSGTSTSLFSTVSRGSSATRKSGEMDAEVSRQSSRAAGVRVSLKSLNARSFNEEPLNRNDGDRGVTFQEAEVIWTALLSKCWVGVIHIAPIQMIHYKPMVEKIMGMLMQGRSLSLTQEEFIAVAQARIQKGKFQKLFQRWFPKVQEKIKQRLYVRCLLRGVQVEAFQRYSKSMMCVVSSDLPPLSYEMLWTPDSGMQPLCTAQMGEALPSPEEVKAFLASPFDAISRAVWKAMDQRNKNNEAPDESDASAWPDEDWEVADAAAFLEGVHVDLPTDDKSSENASSANIDEIFHDWDTIQANSIHCKSCLCWQEPPRITREPPNRHGPHASRVKAMKSRDQSNELVICREHCISVTSKSLRQHLSSPLPKPKCAYDTAAVWDATPNKLRLWQALPWQIQIHFVHANTLDLRVGNAAPRGNDFSNLGVEERMRKKKKSNKFSYLGFAQKMKQSVVQHDEPMTPMTDVTATETGGSGGLDRNMTMEFTISSKAERIREKTSGKGSGAKKVYFE